MLKIRIKLKLKKLRRAPQRFFLDVKRPFFRRWGALFADFLVREGLDKAIYDPIEAIISAEVPILSNALDVHENKQKEKRIAYLASKGNRLVSVIIPVHNAEKTLERSIQALQNQDYPHLELIVVNDGSTDKSAGILAALAAADKRIVLFENVNSQGAALARNKGIKEARGEFLCFQDADDVSASDRISRQLMPLLLDSRKIISVCDYFRVDSTGTALWINDVKISRSIISMMFHRFTVLNKVGYMLGSKVSEDAEYYERIKLVLGSDCEFHLSKTLYIAGYQPNSLLFADGQLLSLSSTKIKHTPSNESSRNVREYKTWHSEIRCQRSSPLVSVSGHVVKIL